LPTLETAGWGGSLHARFSSARTRKPRESRASAYGRSRGDAEARGTASARHEVSGDTRERRESVVRNLSWERGLVGRPAPVATVPLPPSLPPGRDVQIGR